MHLEAAFFPARVSWASTLEPGASLTDSSPTGGPAQPAFGQGARYHREEGAVCPAGPRLDHRGHQGARPAQGHRIEGWPGAQQVGGQGTGEGRGGTGQSVLAKVHLPAFSETSWGERLQNQIGRLFKHMLSEIS